MAEGRTLRLNKVLRELNISLDRAVEHLAKHGVEIEARPTSKISNDVYEILLDGFQTDRNKKAASQEVGDEKRKEKEALRIALEKEHEEKRLAEEKTKKTLFKTESERAVGFKKIGKIDLDVKPVKKEAPVISKTSQEEKAVEIPKTETETEKTPKPKVEKAPPKEVKKAPVKEKIADKTVPKAPVKTEEEAEEKTTDRKILTQYKKLGGPKLTGQKIDLKQFEKPKKKAEPAEKTKAPVKKSEHDNRRKKRRRIHKPIDKSGKGAPSRPFSKSQGRGRTPLVKAEPTEAEVQKQIRETLEKLQGKSKSKGSKHRRDKRDLHRQQTEQSLEQQEAESKILTVTEFVTANEVATMMNVPVTQIISACMSLGMMVTMNQRLDAETLSIVADEFGYEVNFVTAEVEESILIEEDNEEDLLPRAPIVTVMGHVDHGKTLLLDYIRKANVIAGESGGITQHIGAYSVELKDGQKITFLDTPGHEAFTAMRARGAQVTDLAIIVIAADDSIMPQTKEAISHAQAAGIPMVFAINKIDKPDANPEKVKEGLSIMNLLVEDWGGKIQSQDLSAKTGKGVPELLEKVLLEAELLELKANPNKNANGTVVEALLDKGKGYVATILVESGTLKIGDYLLAGTHSGKIKAMFDERGKKMDTAGPSIPVSVLGLDGAPQAGDKFNVLDDEREAKQLATKRGQLQREQSVRTQKHITLDEIGRRIALGDFKELNLILKGDVDGSVEALTDSLEKLSTEEIQVNIIHKGVGAITESDVLLASASDAIIIGFNVRPSAIARQLADKEEIDIKNYAIIYDAINDVKDAMEGMLSPEIKEEITGNAELREIYKISKIGTIAGCMVTNGKIMRNSKIRLIRDGVVVYTGVLASLKRFKDDAKEVTKGFDCGLSIKNYNDIRVNDIIEAYHEVKVKKKLK
ncbi:MAG: translation initiation factor IF-2 [Flavobacteriaceae bacterium]|nr:translation initiation factor IF-2 [Flavobacteriaceae bacterium]